MQVALLKYRSDIDGLRAIAVISVILFHAFPSLFSGGFIGVDVFFVISGFLITSIIVQGLQTNSFTFSDFYSKRIRRIFPALILVLIFSYVLGWFFLVPKEFELLGKHIQTGATFVANFALWNESGYFDVSGEVKPLLHLWSLAIEEQFYIFWPLILFLFHKKRISPWIGILFCTLFSFIVCFVLTQSHPIEAFYSPLSRFWEILIGALLAVYNSKHKASFTPIINEVLSISGIAFFALAFLILNKDSKFPGAWALLPTLGTAFLIAAGERTWINSKFLSHPLMTQIGLFSYPLYLWHWPILSFNKIISTTSPSVATRLLLLGVSFVMAWLTFNLLEIPLRRWKRHLAKTFIYSASMVVLALLGFWTYEQNGLPTRYPSAIQFIAKHSNMKDFHWEQEVRAHFCHILNPESDKRATYCDEQQRPSVFLWGDSHAAALYPGLKHLQKSKNFGVIQLTSSGNPPYLEGAANEAYELINEQAFSELTKIKPDTVILHAAWFQYDESLESTVNKIDFTIKKIRAVSPKSKIVVIGPVPIWKDSLQKNLLQFYITSHPQTMPPLYMKYGLRQDLSVLDSDLKNGLKDMNVVYLSALDVLCNQNGCLTRTGPSAMDLTAVDYGHLSTSGSIYLINHLSKKILQ